jgi:predicted O-methyltransferase YrrM
MFCSFHFRFVNYCYKRPWEKAGAQHSPKETMRKSGCHDLVEFRVSPSLDFLRSAEGEEQYEFIFLDGDHSAKTVYEELPAAMKCLTENGVILLHDYFPVLQPLWSDESVIPGVFLATQRLRNEGAAFNVVPLGKLPWPTKLNSNVTSLALVTGSDHQ